MRITFSSQYRDATAGLETATEQLIEWQRQVATGKRVQKPSHDPSAAASAVSERAQLADAERYSRTGDSVYSRMTVVDTVLSDMIMKLTSAQSAIAGARGTIATTEHREAAAQALEGIRAALVDDMNLSFHGTYVFSGAASTTKPYTQAADGTVSAYAGSTTEVLADISPERTVPLLFNGETIAQGSATDDVFTVLTDLIDAVRAGDETAIDAGVAVLDDAFDRITSAQTRVGVAMNAIEAEQARLSQLELATNARLHELEDVDLAEAVTGMSRADAAYQAALAAVGTAGRVSLMDFLR